MGLRHNDASKMLVQMRRPFPQLSAQVSPLPEKLSICFLDLSHVSRFLNFFCIEVIPSPISFCGKASQICAHRHKRLRMLPKPD